MAPRRSQRPGALLAGLGAILCAAACATATLPTPVPAPDAESLWRRAIGDWERGDDGGALQGIQKLLAYHPDHLEGQRALAEMLLGAHEEAEALAFLRDRSAARPDRVGPRFALGYALGLTGDPSQMSEARLVLVRLAESSGAAVILEVLSDLLAALDDPVAAAGMAERAAGARRLAGQLDEELDAWLKTGRYLYLAGRWDEADAALGKALSQAEAAGSRPGVRRAYQALGSAAQSRGRLTLAASHFQAALKAGGGAAGGLDLSLRVNIAELHELRGDRQAADRVFDDLLAAPAEIPELGAEIRVRRARILADRGDDGGALNELSAAVEVLKAEQAWQRIADALTLAGRVHLDAGRWRDAVTELAQAASVWAAAVEQGANPAGLARAKLRLGEALLDGGVVPDAAELFRDARALAEEAGHQPLLRRAERGGLLCDLRMGTPDDLKLAVDRAQELGDPWVIAEALVGVGDWAAALASAHATLAPETDPELADLPVRYALLVAVLLNNGDAQGAWGAYRAGTVAQLAERLRGAGVSALRPPGEASAELLTRIQSVGAEVQAAEALLDEPLTPSVEALWRGRRRELGVRRRALSEELAAGRPAWASLLLHHAAPDHPSLPDSPGVAWVSVLPGEHEALAFISTTYGVTAERLPALTDGAAADAFWPLVKAASSQAQRFVLSPPPELTHLAWHRLQGAPARANLTYRPSAAPLAKPRSATPGAAPSLPSDPRAVDLPELLAAHLHGITPEFDAPQDPQAAPALDAVIRACLYAGADGVVVRTPDGDSLTYTR